VVLKLIKSCFVCTEIRSMLLCRYCCAATCECSDSATRSKYKITSYANYLHNARISYMIALEQVALTACSTSKYHHLNSKKGG